MKGTEIKKKFPRHFTSLYQVHRVYVVLYLKHIVQEYVLLNEQLSGEINII